MAAGDPESLAKGEFWIGELKIPYRVRVSARARVKRLEVVPGEVVVIVPEGATPEGPESVEAFLRKKQRWLYEAYTDLQRQRRESGAAEQVWERGAKLMYRGRRLMLEIEEGDVKKVSIRCRSRFYVRVPRGLSGAARRAALRHAFHGWMRGRALKDARYFCRRYAARLGEEYEGAPVEVVDSRDMWGSCGRDGVLRINWRLIQAPRVALEYVCAHEVCHLLHRNHGPEFWEALGELMPGWRAAKGELERWERGGGPGGAL